MSYSLGGHTFEALGVKSAVHMENRAAETTLTIDIDQPLNSSPKFAPGQLVTLSGNGARFTGWLDAYPKKATPNSRIWQYVFVGGQRQLLNSTIEEDFEYLTRNDDDEVEVENIGATGLTMLGRAVSESGDQSHKTLGQAIDQVLNHAIGELGGISFNRTASLNAAVPWEARQDDKALAALRALLKWAPDTITWWNGLVLEIFTPNYNSTKTLSAQAQQLRDEIAITPRNDLLCRQTVITYLRKTSGPGNLAEYERRFDSSSLSVDAGSNWPQSAKITVYLEDGEPFPDPGIAEEFQRYAGRRQLSCSATVNGLNWLNKPGDVWTGGGSFQFGASRLVCQQITRDLFTGSERLAFSPPAYLGLGDMVSLKRKPYRRPDAGSIPDADEVTGTLKVQTTPSAETDPDFPTDSVFWTVSLNSGSKAKVAEGLGDKSVELPPGTYLVKWGVVPGYKGGNPVTKTVPEYGEVIASGDYTKNLPPTHPFQVTVENRGTTDAPDLIASVNGGSNLYRRFGTWETVAIEGLATDIPISVGDYIFLEGQYEDGVLTTVSIFATASLPGRIVFSSGENKKQVSWATRIARILAKGKSIIIEQNLRRHLTLSEACAEFGRCEYPE